MDKLTESILHDIDRLHTRLWLERTKDPPQRDDIKLARDDRMAALAQAIETFRYQVEQIGRHTWIE